jgi:hypothetical protein
VYGYADRPQPSAPSRCRSDPSSEGFTSSRRSVAIDYCRGREDFRWEINGSYGSSGIEKEKVPAKVPWFYRIDQETVLSFEACKLITPFVFFLKYLAAS